MINSSTRTARVLRRTAGAVAGVAATAAVLAGCTSATTATAGAGATGGSSTGASSTGGSSTGASGSTTPTATASASPSPTPSTPASTAPPPPRRGHGTPVHVSLLEADGSTYGIAMPIIAYFSVAPTDASVFDKVTTVTVNGRVVHGAWYFEHSSRSSEALEAHYRLAGYWPAHARIHVDLPVKGLWAGKGLVFDDSLTLSVRTGAAHLVKINGKPGIDSMRVFSDGKLIRRFKISLGAATTPTYRGTAVVMSKSNPQLMTSSPGEAYYRIEVPWSVRVTYDGEFLHDAYWNGELGRQNLSHGCTNMRPADAEWYYHWSLIGDPVTWINTGTTKVVPVTDGYGDWNLPFARYAKGGLLPPS